MGSSAGTWRLLRKKRKKQANTHVCAHTNAHNPGSLSSGVWLDLYGLICLKLSNAVFFILRLILRSKENTHKNNKKNKNPRFSKDSNFYSILISVSTVLPVYTGMCTAPGSFITFLETADVWLCSPGDHLKSFKLPEDRCFFYSPLSKVQPQ